MEDLTQQNAAADAAGAAITATAAEPIMQDFVFGGIEANDAQLLAHLRARGAGVRHEYAIEPRDPLPGQPVTLTVTLGADVVADHVCAYVTTDGAQPAGSRGAAHAGVAVPLARTGVRWATPIWGYVEVWQGEIPAQANGAFVQYVIEAWHTNPALSSHWSREQHIDGAEEARTLYAYSVDTDAPPEWARDAILYQVFVDRFHDPTRTDAQHADVPPEQLRSRTFWGGTLRGIAARLDYIAGLGVTVLWLSPIFRTPTNHGYDTIDYYAVEPRFGTEADLRALVDAAHARGLRVVLDLVVNHVSLEFAPFQRAQADVQAAERTWFSFGPHYTHGFRTFFNVATMPQLDLDDPGARAYMVDVARHYLLDLGVDGYRLDYAAGPSYGFWSAFRRACRAARPDCWLFGEVTLAGDALRAYTGRLDGCLDFGFARALRGLCLPPHASIAGFAAWLERHRAFYGDDFVLPAFLDNHDMNRFLYVAGNNQQTLRLAAGLLFALGGPPVIYYGTEVGQSQPRAKGPHREESRHPMRWGDAQDAALHADFARLIAARRAHPALARGDLRTLWLDDAAGLWLAERTRGADRVLVAVNISAAAQALPLPPGGYLDITAPANPPRAVQRDTILVPGRTVRLLRPA